VYDFWKYFLEMINYVQSKSGRSLTMLKKITLPVVLLGLMTGLSFAQGQSPASVEVIQKIEISFALLGDGRNEAYGMYVAGARSKKYVYMLSLNSLAVGLDVKMRFTGLGGKANDFEAEKLRADEALGVAIYTVKTSTKDLIPITKHPDLSLAQNAELWTLGASQTPKNLIKVSAAGLAPEATSFTVSGSLSALFAGLPVFDASGKVLGMIAAKNPDGSYNAVTIAELLNFAAKAFAAEALDLYPTWDEVYPSQYSRERVRASAAILETGKPGTGFFIARDKNDVGYLLTANHVIEGEEEFSINFSGYEESGIIGKPLAGAQDAGLDLAIVVVEQGCPPVKPVIFWSPKDFKQLKKNFADSTEAVANVGRSQSLEDYFQYKQGFIRGENLEGQFIQTDLQLESGDSGGPLFNKNGEIVGINLKTALQESNFSVANNIETILKYLDEKLKKVELKQKWEFLLKPSYWSRNKNWMLPAGATTLTATGAILYNVLKPETAFADVPGLPPTQ
jgi:hypothetical protein